MCLWSSRANHLVIATFAPFATHSSTHTPTTRFADSPPVHLPPPQMLLSGLDF